MPKVLVTSARRLFPPEEWWVVQTWQRRSRRHTLDAGFQFDDLIWLWAEKSRGKSKSDSLSANFQSFSRIIVKRAKLGLSLLNRLQYIPICKILPNDRPHEYSWFCLESFITDFWKYCCFAQGRFCSKTKVANHALQFTHPLIGLEANLISEMSSVREGINCSLVPLTTCCWKRVTRNPLDFLSQIRTLSMIGLGCDKNFDEIMTPWLPWP